MATQKKPHWLKDAAERMTRLHFLYILAYAGSLVVFDSWNLIPRDGIVMRWQAAGLLLAINVALWYLAKMKFSNADLYRLILFGLIAADLIFIANNIYWERGMASKAVAQFALPIIVAASLRSRAALIGTATLTAGVYATSVISYFFDNYGEGYRVELYGTVAFYSALFFIFAWFLKTITKPSNDS